MNLVMKRIVKKLFPKLALHYKAYQILIKNERSYLYLSGWMESLSRSRPVDSKKESIPWMNFCVIQFLKQRLKNDLMLFEFGSGYSTHFYADRVKSVTSVEYDKDWFELVKQDLPKNVELIFKEKDTNGNYCHVISSFEKQFDVVVIDGWDRANCMRQAISKLSPKGIILLDDSSMSRHKEAVEVALEQGFLRLDFEGLKPTDNGIYRTTIFYRHNNCFGI